MTGVPTEWSLRIWQAYRTVFEADYHGNAGLVHEAGAAFSCRTVARCAPIFNDEAVALSVHKP